MTRWLIVLAVIVITMLTAPVALAMPSAQQQGAADLSIVKLDSPDPVIVESNVAYTLVVLNSGPAVAAGVSLTDTLPASTSFVSATFSQGGCAHANGTVTCSLGNLASGAGTTVEIVVTPHTVGTILNTASVAAGQSDPNLSNNTAHQDTTVNPTADVANLAVTKADSPDPVNVGSTLTYTMVVTNEGPAAASGVMLTDGLPSGVAFVSATATQGSCAETGGIVTCNLGNLANGASATVTLVVTPSSVSIVTNTASVIGHQTDSDSTNNTASQSTTVDPSLDLADLALTKGDAPDPVVVEKKLTYAIVATNKGPSGASGVTVTDTLPSGATFVSATATQGSCTQSGGIVTCTLDNLVNGASATVTIVVAPKEAGTLVNTASVTGHPSDPDGSNNSASQTTTVNPRPTPPPEQANPPEMVTICHKPGTPAEHTMTIPERAWKNGHSRHGDTMEDCP